VPTFAKPAKAEPAPHVPDCEAVNHILLWGGTALFGFAQGKLPSAATRLWGESGLRLPRCRSSPWQYWIQLLLHYCCNFRNPVKRGLVRVAEHYFCYFYRSARPGFELCDLPQRLKPVGVSA
jgi:hypothetical protein